MKNITVFLFLILNVCPFVFAEWDCSISVNDASSGEILFSKKVKTNSSNFRNAVAHSDNVLFSGGFLVDLYIQSTYQEIICQKNNPNLIEEHKLKRSFDYAPPGSSTCLVKIVNSQATMTATGDRMIDAANNLKKLIDSQQISIMDDYVICNRVTTSQGK